MQKQLEGTQKYINAIVDRVAHIDGQLMQLLWAIHTRFQRSIMLVYKPSNPFTNVCWVSVLTTFSAPPQIFGCIDSFLLPNSRTKKWWVMVSFGATAAGLFWTVNVCWAHPVIYTSSMSSIFHGVIPDAFEVRRIVCRKLKQTLNNELKFHIVNIY